MLRDRESGERKVNAGSDKAVISKLEKSSYCEMVRTGVNTGKNLQIKVARASVDNFFVEILQRRETERR